MGARRKGRVIAFQTLYRYGCTEEAIEDLCEFSWLMEDEKSVKFDDEVLNFARLLMRTDPRLKD